MRRRTRIRATAERDLDGHVDRIAADNPKAARRVREAIKAAYKKLAEMPELGSVYDVRNPRLAGLRLWPTRGFEHYAIFYLTVKDGIEVVRVLHAAMDIDSILEVEP